MELAEILRVLWRRRLASLVVLLLAGAGAFGAGQLAHSTPTGSATVQLLVDSPQSALADLQQSTVPLITRATLLAQVMASETVLEGIAHSAGVPAGALSAQGPYSGPGEALDVVTPAGARSSQLLGERSHYRLAFVAQADEPVITASVQGPTPLSAGHVAEAIYPAVSAYVQTLQQQAQVKPVQRLTIRQLGAAQAASVNSSSRLALMAVAALAVLILGLLLLVGVEAAARRRAPDAAGLERELAAELDHADLGHAGLDPADIERLPREERPRSVA